MIWSERTDGELRRLFRQELVITEIAKAMGTSKGSIVGRLHRLNLYRGTRPGPRKKVLEPVAIVPDRRKPRPPSTAPLGQPAPLLRLDSDGCRWPVSPHTASSHVFCNAHRMPDRAYCRRHWLKAIGGHL